jgi:glycosyltransferase involved in cell wall biosynthesis
VEEGHEVTILTFKLQYPGFLFPGKTQFSAAQEPDDLKIDVAINSINPLNWIRVGRKYKKLMPDVVVFRYWMPFMGPCLGTIARFIKKNKYSRCYAITDNIIPHEKRIGDRPFTTYFLKSIHGFIAMSRKVLSDISLFNEDKPRKYIPHPLYDDFGPAIDKDVAKLALGLDAETNYLLFFGFIRAYKGLDLLLKSFKKVDRERINVKLMVAGEFYENEEYYLDLIEQLGLKDEVILHTDFIPNNHVPLYFSAVDMVTQTYKSATQSGVTQIAYYYKKPMLVTDVGGLAELIPHQKVGYVCAQDENEIARSIEDFYTGNRAESFRAHIEDERKRFEWSSLVEELLTLEKV